jgi:HAE1 family hydrophobic/amphiphilic exporter-1
VVLIGGVILAGIVVNNSIVLIDFTNQLREQGKDKFQAIQEACAVRLRPILMTTSTTVLGLIPMAVSLGEGSELRVPMAVTVIGGLMTSTLLTLALVPVLYTLLTREKVTMEKQA